LILGPQASFFFIKETLNLMMQKLSTVGGLGINLTKTYLQGRYILGLKYQKTHKLKIQ
jgi:hypothetical protein